MAQPSLILEYDLGGEGDLFKAPEPIIEEPPLLLPAGDDDAINVGLFEALYECEKELMEKSVIEETISELLDVEIAMLRVEEEVPAGELHNSPSSGSDTLSPSVWPNFLDFQGLDLEAAFGLSTAYCQGDIQV